jgi:DNA-binding FadR family transcriptional regulator
VDQGQGAAVAKGNLLSHAIDALGEAIVAGRHPVGSTLPPEPALGQALGVSRTVVREAVKSLAAKGLLVSGPKLGTRVLAAAMWNGFDPDVVAWQARAGLTGELLRDLQELRRVVEPAAVRLAARRADAADMAALEAAYAGMAQAVARGGDYVPHDLAFHQGLLRASHNRMMVQVGKALVALLRTSFELSTSRPDAAAMSLPLHRAVLDALIARAPQRAERASRRLIDGAAEDIDAVLAARRPAPVPAARPGAVSRPGQGGRRRR